MKLCAVPSRNRDRSFRVRQQSPESIVLRLLATTDEISKVDYFRIFLRNRFVLSGLRLLDLTVVGGDELPGGRFRREVLLGIQAIGLAASAISDHFGLQIQELVGQQQVR